MIPVETAQDITDGLGLLRMLAQLTQRELAAEAGVTQTEVALFEAGQRMPGPAKLLRVLRAVGHRLAIVPLDHDGPASPLSATLADEHPSAGVLGYTGGAEGGSEGSQAASEWNWAPTADGGSYSGPHGPNICPAVGCRHEGGAA